MHLKRLTPLILVLAVCTPSFAAVLEVPQDGGFASGIGYISGWKCPPNDKISVVIDGGSPIPVPSGVRRNDTAGACGNDGRNGYITQINFGLLGDGTHTVAVRQNGQSFVTSTFNVTTFGTPFLTGASGTYTLQDFPAQGKTATIIWNQGTQSFVVAGTGGDGPATPTPRPSVTPTPQAAQVRYLNSTTCAGQTFFSTLTKGKYVWQSLTDFSSPYQAVKESSLSDFDVDNGNCGSFHNPGGFTLETGRKYAIVQSSSFGEARLFLVDEGPVSQAAGEEQ